MRLYEILNEDVSVDASLKNIVDVLTTELPELYRQLGKMAENYERNHGELGKGFAFITGGPKSKWFQEVFTRAMKPALYNLSKKIPKHVAEPLNRFLDSTVGGGKFNMIQDTLIDVLGNIAKSTKNEKLLSATGAAKKAISTYQALLDRLEAGSDDDFDEPVVSQPKQPNPVAQQNASVEAIVNDVLSRLDKKVAGDIRNAISKSGNKLQALQQELKRHGINL